jgi:hypothetical protein
MLYIIVLANVSILYTITYAWYKLGQYLARPIAYTVEEEVSIDEQPIDYSI